MTPPAEPRRIRPAAATAHTRTKALVAAACAVILVITLVVACTGREPSHPAGELQVSGAETSRQPAVRTPPAPTSGGRPAPPAASTAPPPKGGYFQLQPVGASTSLPDDASCARQAHYSTWEPRPDNTGPNHVMPDAAAVHRALGARPVSGDGSYAPRWDSWLLQRVDGQFTGTTDEIFQWAACKWGLPDDVLRAIAVRESTWYQYEVYPSGRPVLNWGMGDMMVAGTNGAAVYCDGIAQFGRDYQADFGAGSCPRTFSIAGVMSWQAPSWGKMAGNQNGTFPFSRDSTAFALDYLAAQLRGCYNGWEYWLANSGRGAYRAGDLWGCVGAWYSGDWHGPDAEGYIARVRAELADFTWLQADWSSERPPCDPHFGCARGS